MTEDTPATRIHPAARNYGAAFAIFLAALGLSRLLDPYVAPHSSAPYYLAVILSTAIGGAVPGLLVTAASSLAIAYFDLGTSGSLNLGADDLLRLAAFTATSLIIGYIGARRAAAEASLRAALVELSAVDRTKDEFIAALSHELKTPLTSILGWLRILKEEDLDPETRRTALRSVEESARTQSMLVDDLLDVSRIVVGKFAIARDPVNLAEVLSDAIDLMRPAARSRSIDLRVVVPPSPVIVSGDPGRLKQVVWNYVNNAIKFAREAGSVRVTLKTEGADAVLEVNDDGEGIAPDLLPHLFRRFRQGEGSEHRGGLGLGLSIVKHVVEVHGGTVSAHSAGKGQGATFIARLPLTLRG